MQYILKRINLYNISMPTPEERRYEYVRRPEVKAKANEISKRRSKERKRKHTLVRIQEHTMDELMQCVKDICLVKSVNYGEVKDQYLQMMTFLHDI
jgi:hypothetical protein